MWTDVVIVPPPALDDDPCFGEGVEDFSVEQLVAQTGVEALDEALLPRAARRDVCGFRADGGDPLLHSLCDEPGAVVGTASRSRPLLGCLAGTFSSSPRQMRSTRLLLTIQPACVRNSAEIFR